MKILHRKSWKHIERLRSLRDQKEDTINPRWTGLLKDSNTPNSSTTEPKTSSNQKPTSDLGGGPQLKVYSQIMKKEIVIWLPGSPLYHTFTPRKEKLIGCEMRSSILVGGRDFVAHRHYYYNYWGNNRWGKSCLPTPCRQIDSLSCIVNTSQN